MQLNYLRSSASNYLMVYNYWIVFIDLNLGQSYSLIAQFFFTPTATGEMEFESPNTFLSQWVSSNPCQQFHWTGSRREKGQGGCMQRSYVLAHARSIPSPQFHPPMPCSVPSVLTSLLTYELWWMANDSLLDYRHTERLHPSHEHSGSMIITLSISKWLAEYCQFRGQY